MDLNTIDSIVRPASRSELPRFSPGDAWLAGGTWIFSEPQRHLRRLIDLSGLGWPALRASRDGLVIASTCTVSELEAFEGPSEWRASQLIPACCHAFWASFKVWNTATVGGNLCLGLPAGPLIALASALEASCLIWTPDGGERVVSAEDFVIGPQQTVLRPGELLRELSLPAAALRRRAALRQTSLTPHGRSAALLIGTLDDDGGLRLTVTASTPRPVVLTFARLPNAVDLQRSLAAVLPPGATYDDPHGSPAWRDRLTRDLAEEIRSELAR